MAPSADQSGYDSDGVRENEETRRSEERRKAAERQRESQRTAAKASAQEDVRLRFRNGELSMAEFAKLAREAGISTSEVAKTLREAQAAKAKGIDMAAVSRGDHEAVTQSLKPEARRPSMRGSSTEGAKESKPVAAAALEAAEAAETAARDAHLETKQEDEVLPKAAGASNAPLQRSHYFLELSVGGEQRGRLVVQLFDDLVPKTAANFGAFCQGFTMSDKHLHYAGCAFHRLVAGFVLQGGDVISGDGSGSACIFSEKGTFPDERLDLPHARPGILSMANMGRDSNGCQFFITLQPTPSLDGKHVVFGRLLAGMRLLRQLEYMPTDDKERPITPLVILACGRLSTEEAVAAANAEGDAAIPSEAIELVPTAKAERAEALDLGGEALVVAAARSDVQMLRSLVQSGVPIDAYGTVDEAGPLTSSIECTALHVAASAADLATVQALITGGADVNLSDSRSRTALYLSSMSNSVDCVRALLTAGARLHDADSDGKMPVHVASARGASAVLRELLEHDSSLVEIPCSALLPIHLASVGDHPESVKMLATMKADVNTLAASEHSPLHLAAGAGATRAASALLAAGANPLLHGERSGKTPLHCACERGRPRAAEVLLAAGASVHDVDATGATALHWACRGGSLEAARLLLEANANVDKTTKRESRALHLACEARAPDVTALLLDRGANSQAADASGITPLHAAAASGCLASARALLQAGAHVDPELHIRGKDELSHAVEAHVKRPLFLAAEKGYADLVQLLLDGGAEPNALATVDGAGSVSRVSPLWAARRGGHTAVIDLLERAGAMETADTTSPDGARKEVLV